LAVRVAVFGECPVVLVGDGLQIANSAFVGGTVAAARPPGRLFPGRLWRHTWPRAFSLEPNRMLTLAPSGTWITARPR